MERYAKEVEDRFNRRVGPEMMLDELLSRFTELDALSQRPTCRGRPLGRPPVLRRTSLGLFSCVRL